MEGVDIRRFFSILAMAIAITLGLAGVSFAADGKSLTEQNCVRCHKDDVWRGVKKAREDWSKVIDRMDRNGASEYISGVQELQIIDYLVSQGAPEAARTVAVTTQPAVAQTATPTAPTTPKEQANTGAEVWLYLLGGGSMMTSGLKMRHKKRS
ncbi:MAG: hypothetical protein M1548_06640 [Actinobacteria bacterium]|nr:hypothetical protein [Actinomycetota bacterium]